VPVLLGLAAAYSVAGKAGLEFALDHESASPVWPPTGLAIAAVLLRGPEVWPAIFLGAFLVNVTTAGSAATSLGIAVGNTLEALLAGHLVRRFAGGPAAFERTRDVFRFAALAGFASTAVSATIGVSSLLAGGFARADDAARIWWTWWLGDLAGALVVTPLVVLWARTRPVDFGTRTGEAGLLVVATVLAAMVAFGEAGSGHSISFLCLPPLAWAAFRFGPREVASCVVAFSAIAVWGTTVGMGTFSRGSPGQSLLLLQAFMATISMTMLPMATMVAETRSVAEERRRAREAADRESARLSAVLRHIPAAVLIVDAPSGRVVLGNEQVERIFGRAFVPGEPLDAGHGFRALDDDGRPYEQRDWPIFRSLATGETVIGEEVRFERDDGTSGTLSTSAAPILDAQGSRIAAVLVVSDVTERKRVEVQREELLLRERELRSQAEVTSRAKDEFLAMLSHELRNPLAAVRTAVHLLEAPVHNPEQTAQATAILGRQVRHLGRLVDDLLDIAIVTSGGIVLQRRLTDLAQVVADGVSALRLAGRLDAHELAVDLRPAWAYADPLRLQQVVTNLLTNAVKYTPEGGHLRVTTDTDGASAVLFVEDDGIGIPADKLPHVFELFFQAEGTLDRPQGGLGLGLTLVRRLVELHGGTVEAASPGPGSGTAFAVRLPSVPAPTDAAPASPREAAPGKRWRVLLVEDNADARESLRIVLERAGHEVTCAEDGPAGVAAALRSRPDVALVDVGLPGFDGYEVARRIRSTPAGDDIVLAALTGYGQPGDRRRAEAAGFDLHVVKPVDPARLVALLAGAARRRESEA
jgi:signal transduction histidine kinase/CheY-like chemotaxis protein